MSIMIENCIPRGKTRLVGRDVIRRWEGNPILELEDILYAHAGLSAKG